MSDEQPVITFATEADRKAWEHDLIVFGSATVDQDGKHVPLTLLPSSLASRFEGQRD